jgi:hypothetical protein
MLIPLTPYALGAAWIASRPAWVAIEMTMKASFSIALSMR